MTKKRPEPGETLAERADERTFVVTRRFAAPPRLVFDAWTRPELLKRWWTPKSFGIDFLECEVDARTGGSYRFVMGHASAPEPMAFFGRYTEVIPGERLVWTNEESGEAGQITTVTFEADGAGTIVTMTDVYPSIEAMDEAMQSGSTSGFEESFAQLDETLADPR